MKGKYKFNDKDLGRLFMERLVKLGYKEDKEVTLFDIDTVIITRGKEAYGVFSGQIYHDCTTFQLETQWNEALAFAKEQIEPEFEVGDWVYFNAFKEYGPVKIERIVDEHVFFTGNDILMWRDKGNEDWYNVDNFKRKATKDEVEKALIKEAERRGFCSCKEWKSAKTGYTNFYAVGDFYYDDKKDLLYMDGGTVYYKGKWATIVDEPEFDLPEIRQWLQENGYTYLICKSNISFHG